MRKDLADITLVVDRSRSMQTVRQEAENGVNAFVEDQRKQVGRALLTLVQFDTEYEFVHRGVDVVEVPRYALVPRGMTALLDAVGRAINETGERLKKMDEAERPGLVVFVIVTDGEENSSHEFTKQQIKEMITRQQDEYSWQFTFLGANQDAFAEAAGIGIAAGQTMAYDQAKTGETFDVASASVGRMRQQSFSGQAVGNAYTDAERRRTKR